MQPRGGEKLRSFILGPDGKACIWPIPYSCIWTGERYSIKRQKLKIFVHDIFMEEARIFKSMLEKYSPVKVEILKSDISNTKAEISEGDISDINDIKLETLENYTNVIDVKILRYDGENLECNEKDLSSSSESSEDNIENSKCNGDNPGDGEYLLDVTERGIIIQGLQGRGILNGCMTLLQLILNSPNASIPGVSIVDKPSNEYRYVCMDAPTCQDLDWFDIFIDILVKYKFNGVYFKNSQDDKHLNVIIERMNQCHIKIVTREEYLLYKDYCVHINCGTQNDYSTQADYSKHADYNVYTDSNAYIETEAGYGLKKAVIKNLYKLIKSSNTLWQSSFMVSCVGTGGFLCHDRNKERSSFMDGKLPYMDERLSSIVRYVIKDGFEIEERSEIFCEWMEKMLAQLCTVERDKLRGIIYPSLETTKFKTFDLKQFYNAPLYRLCWNHDDYDYMFMIEAKYVPNTVPFSILQGALDYKLDNAFILAGNGWNEGITGINVNLKLRSLCFLHSDILASRYMWQIDGDAGQSDKSEHLEVRVGWYIIHYADGSKEKVEIVYGRNIFHWNVKPWNLFAAYEANPAYLGITSYNIPYVMFSYEWINNKPDIPIERIDILPSENHRDGGIAVFAITGIPYEK